MLKRMALLDSLYQASCITWRLDKIAVYRCKIESLHLRLGPGVCYVFFKVFVQLFTRVREYARISFHGW